MIFFVYTNKCVIIVYTKTVNIKIMRATEKQQLINKLVKNGNNIEKATEMVNEHYEYVSKYYTGISKMAKVIICL